MSSKTRLAIVVSHPIQHFVHFYRALATVPNLELKVFYATNIGIKSYFDAAMGVQITWNADLLSGYNHEFLPEAESISKSSFSTVNNPSIAAALSEFRPDVVKIHGYAQMTLLRALFWCRTHKVPALLWSDSELRHHRPLLKQLVKEPILRVLLAQFAAILSVGDNNEAYFRHYGVPQSSLFRTPFTIDEASFKAAYARRDDIRREWRARLGIPDDAFVVFNVGKLITRKRPGDLVAALKHIAAGGRVSRPVVAAFAGNGELMEQCKRDAAELGPRCAFLGFVNLDLLPEAYVMSDALAHLSDMDPHPLTTSEASCVGLPLIISDRVGAIGPTDVARPGFNTITYACGNIPELANAIEQLATDDQRYAQMSANSLTVARELNIDASVKGIMSAISAVTRGR